MQYSVVVTYSSALHAITHVSACYYFIEILKFDVTGLGYATMVSNGICLMFLLIASSCIEKIAEAVQLPNAAALQDWGSFIQLALPALLTVCSDWWAFELLLFISGYAGVTEQAAFVILVTVTALIFMVPLGLSVTACTLIGNSIGK